MLVTVTNFCDENILLWYKFRMHPKHIATMKTLRGGELRLFLHLKVQKENALTERVR